MCSGRVDAAFVLRAFSKGADGVFIGACHLSECNYMTNGNFQALSMVSMFKRIMEHAGINPQRLKIAFMSGSEANVFTENVNDFIQKVKALGPLGQSEGLGEAELKSGLDEAAKLIPYFKLVKRDKLALRLNDEKEYDDLFTKDEVDRLFSEAVSYYIDPAGCRACMACFRKCPVDAIAGGKNLVHIIDQEKCIRCGTCFDSCPPRFGAIRKISGEPVPPPIPEEARIISRESKQK